MANLTDQPATDRFTIPQRGYEYHDPQLVRGLDHISAYRGALSDLQRFEICLASDKHLALAIKSSEQTLARCKRWKWLFGRTKTFKTNRAMAHSALLQFVAEVTRRKDK